MRHFHVALAAAAATALTASAAHADGHLGGAKLGLLLAYSGPLETMAPPIGDSAMLVADQVNAQGGILEGELEFVTGDSTCVDSTAGTNAADRLVNADNVAAIVGAMCSGNTIAIANTVGVPSNVVMISPSATSPAVTVVDDNDLLFRVAPSDAYQGQVLARLLMSKGIEDIAIAYVNNDYGKGFADSLATAFAAGGGEVTANLAHEEGKSDYRAELGSLASSGSLNLVVLAYASGSGQTLVRQAVESGDFEMFVGGDGMVADDLFTGTDAAMLDGMIATRPSSPETPASTRYAELASAAGVDPTAVFGAQAYDAAFLLALAIEQKGDASRDGMSEALRAVATAPGEVILPGEWEKAKALIAAGTDINYEGAAGPHEFDGNGDVAGVISEMTAAGGSFEEVGVVE